MVLSRRRDPEAAQGHLWDAAGYAYGTSVTNLAWALGDIAAFYGKRADVEKAIQELKMDFGLDRIASSRFLTNAADLKLKVLAYNLVVLNQRQALGWAVVHRAKTLRRRVLTLAGQLIRTVGKWILTLAADGRARAALERVRLYLASLSP